MECSLSTIPLEPRPLRGVHTVIDSAGLAVRGCFAGGFGSLARFIGAALPLASVQIVEPHWQPATIEIASDIPSDRFVPEFTG